MSPTRPAPLLPLLLAALACEGPRSEGWAPAQNTGGPVVLWDIEAQPLPELPLPNDAATRLDPRSPTGRRLNISVIAPTEVERDVRAEFDKMDGFGTFAPLMVSFDAPLDPADLYARHATNHDFRDDAVFLLNVDPSCERFGEEVALDMGSGRFPVTLYSRGQRIDDPLAPGGYRLDFGGNSLSLFDDQADASSTHFEQHNEDLDGDGVLDPGEDIDSDGILDVANFIDPAACDGLQPQSLAHDQCVADHLMNFYDRTSNTLILRPLWPMEQRCTHAVILTNRVLGEDGRAVMSPFPGVNARDQTEDLQPATELLGRYGLSLSDVAFAWTFTTGSMTADLEGLRAGLYGAGPLARLAEAYPASGLRFWRRRDLASAAGSAPPSAAVADDRHLPGACAGAAFTWLWDEGLGEWDANMCAVEADMSSIAALTFGTFVAPDLLVDRDGHATERYPADDDERWDVDLVRGEVVAGDAEVTFWCALPYERDDVGCAPGNPDGQPFCKPFPVVLYGHGYGSNRGEMSLHMGRHTAMGAAACALDFKGHGLNRWREDPAAAGALLAATGTFTQYGVPELGGVLTLGRDRDLNSDGLSDPGADMWTADVFHTRDMVRQIVLEHMQFVRILRSMDGETRDQDGHVLGDVDGDGEVDLGGPNATLAMWGISLGGIVAGVLAGAEPSLDAVSPNAGGAGLTDVSTRSTERGVPDAVVMPILGPFVAGCLPTDGHDNPLPLGESTDLDCWQGEGSAPGPYAGGALRLGAFIHDNARIGVRELGVLDGVQPGDRVLLENLVNGEVEEGRVNERGWFRIAVPADALNATERRAALGLSDGATSAVATDTTAVGDALRLTIFVGDSSSPRHVVSTFPQEVEFQGTRYPAGQPLVALQEGLGHRRNSPDFRRFVAIAQHAISPADPGVWAEHVWESPLDVSYDPHRQGGNTRTLFMPTTGDSQVPPNTGVAMARNAGVLGSWRRDPDLPAEQGWRALFTPDPALGMAPDDWLVSVYALEGDDRLQRFPDNEVTAEVVYDVANVSDGDAAWSCGPSDWSAQIGENNCPPELEGQEVFFGVPHLPDGGYRPDVERDPGRHDAFRLPSLRPGGQHGIYNAQSFRVFDNDAFMVNFTSRFLVSGGREVGHAAGCDCSAAELPAFTLDGAPANPTFDEGCAEDDLKLCDDSCTAAWGLWTPPEAACAPE